MSISFAVESYSFIRDEVAPLAVAHWQETEEAMYGAQDAVPIHIDQFYGLDQAGMLHIGTVRVDGKLQGYAAFAVMPNPHMPGRTLASLIALYLSPQARASDQTLALRLLRWSEAKLREAGVHGVNYSSPSSRPCDALYRRLGAVHTETTWHKEL